MIKFIKRLIWLGVIGLLFLGIKNNYSLIENNIKGIIANVLDSNKDNWTKFISLGELVNDKEIDSLKDSGITGDNYNFDSPFYPYFDMLNDEEKILYKQLVANINELSTTFVPQVTLKTEAVNRIIESVFNDHPEFFWLDTNYSYKYTKSGNCVQIILSFNETINDYENAKILFEKEAQIIVDDANKFRTNYEKEKYVHDTLIEEIEYDTNALINQSAYSALVNKRSVCAGYARAFQYIMMKLGIPTFYVTGMAIEEHAWNIVKLGDGYYNVDLTWDDTNASYNYFNVRDDLFFNTHERSGLSLNLPDCQAYGYSDLEQNKNENIFYRDIKWR